jgi:PAS domain S-box-containing protein
MGTFDWDVVQGTVAWSPALERLHGYAPGGFAGTIEAYWNEVHPDDQGHLAELMPEILAGRRPHHLEYRIVRTDGSVRWVEGRGTVMRDAGGRPLRIVGICADITERKHAEHELQRLAAIVHSSRDAIVSKTLEGRITSWNPSAERIFGYTADEMIGSAIFRLIPEAHHDQEREWLRRIGAGEVVESYDAQRIRKDGRVVVTAVTISPIHDAGGKVVGASSIKRDVSEQREVQEALRRSEARYRSLTQATSAAVWSIGPGGPGEEGARWWCALTGQRPEQVMTADWLDALHPDDRDAARAAWQQAMATGGVFQHEYRVRAIDGTYRHISVRGVPVPAGAGAPVEWVGTFDDVTEQRETEERLRQGAKMEAVGRLAGGLAHDFNNQLHAVSGFASFVAREPGLSDRAQQDLAEIRKAAERMAGLTRQLLAFSRQQVLAPETLDLDAAIADSESMLQRLIGSDIEMHLVPARRPVWVRVDRAQLLQILLNLAINARDAMPSGGHLTLRTRERVVTGTRAALGPGYASVEPGVYAELLVTDTGAGIAPEHLPFLFEPFFTTKEVGKGTGLGLATVHGIVTQSRGYVWAESPLGGGATFTVLLPLADAPEPGAAAGGRAPSRGAQPARILVVDDEPSALALAVRTLREEGHDVWSAVNGRLALEELERLGGAVDVVVTDIVMPVMGGRELGERLAREHPGIALIWMSGYPVDTLVASPGLLERYPFLQKPVQPDLLAETVRMVLARRRGRASGEALMHAAE